MSENEEKKGKDPLIEEFGLTPDDIEMADKAFRVFFLINGFDWEEKPYWAYMAVPPGNIPDLQLSLEMGKNDLINFGDILHFGYGETPPPETKQIMEEEFGMQHDFEQQVQNIVEEVQERQNVIDKYSGKRDIKEEEDSSKDTE
jgi:hypothetical protein